MNKLNTSVRVTELGDTSLRLADAFKQNSSVQKDEFVKTTFTEAEEKGQSITTAVKTDQALSRLEDADAERDEALRVLDKLLKGYENIPIENLRNHAKKLITIFNKYGVKITKENYTSQSNLIASLLEDFSAEHLKDSIEALSGVKEAIANIKTTQETFAKERSKYENELVSQKGKASATSLRKPLLELINKKIIPYLSAMEIAQPEVFKEFVAKVSEIIQSTNEAIKARGKKHNQTGNSATL